MNSFIFLNIFEYFINFLTFLKIPFSKKIQGNNRRTVSSVTQKILKCNMESFYGSGSKFETTKDELLHFFIFDFIF